MRPIQALFVLLLVAGLGFLVWFATGAGKSGPKVAGPAPIEAIARELPVPQPLVELAPTPELPGVGARDPAGRNPLTSDLPLPGPGGAGRTIRGRVVDAAGSPVVDARVVAAPARGVALVALDLLDESAAPWLHRVNARSGPDGRFELAHMPGDSLRLAVRAPGFAPLRTERALSGPERDRLGDLSLERGVVLSGRVVDSAGRAVPGAELRGLPGELSGLFAVSMDSAGSLLGVTDVAGRFELDEVAAGGHRIAVQHADHPTALIEGSAQSPGELQSGILVQLEDGSEIAGVVLGLEPGEEVGFVVYAYRTVNEEGLLVTAVRSGEIEADGRFLLRGLRGDDELLLKLHATQDGAYGNEHSVAVHARPGDTDITLERLAGLSVIGRVVHADTDAAIEGFVVEAGSAWLSPEIDADGNTIEVHPDGRFRFQGVATFGGLDSVSVRVRAEGFASYVESGLEVPPGRVIDLGVIRLQPVPYLIVHVLDASNEAPLKGALVVLEVEESESQNPHSLVLEVTGNESQRATSDANGVARMPSIPGRLCRLLVKHEKFAEFMSDPIELSSSGDTEHRVRLLSGGRVEVRVLDASGAPARGVAVWQRRSTALSPLEFAVPDERTTDEHGSALFEHLTAGAHAFRVPEKRSGSGTGLAGMIFRSNSAGAAYEDWYDVQVREGTRDVITLELPARGALFGHVSEAGRSLSGAALTLERAGSPNAPILGLGNGPRAKTNGRGEYRFEDVRAGEWRLRVSHASRVMSTALEVVVLEGETEFDVTLDLSVVEGRITDEAGDPLPGARVNVRRTDGVDTEMRMKGMLRAGDGTSLGLPAGAGQGALSDADGRYQLRGVATGVELEVGVHAEGCQPAASELFELRPGETRGGVDVQLRYGGRVNVRVHGADGQPASFVLVTASYAGEAGEEPLIRREFIQEGGRTSFHGLAPGEWRISARSMGLDDPDSKILWEPVAVEVVSREEREVRLDL